MAPAKQRKVSAQSIPAPVSVPKAVQRQRVVHQPERSPLFRWLPVNLRLSEAHLPPLLALKQECL